jgi:hypothetical protein
MGIGYIWDIVWDSEPFHWATAFVLAIAIFIEVVTLWQYWNDKDFRKTATAIKNLQELGKNPKAKLTDKDISDLKKHFGVDDHYNIKQQDQKFVLTKYPSILARPIPRSSLRFVTTLCTAIGVLGTFYGIQEGLQGIDLSSKNSQQLMASSQNLLMGMKTAFSTSLMGLGSGSLFTLILFASETLRQQRRDSLRQKLKAIAILETADNANQKAAESLSIVANKLTGLNQLSAESIGEAVGTAISRQFAGLNQLSSQAIGEALGQQMQLVIIPELQKMYQEQQKLREIQENQGQRVLEKLIQDLRIEVIEPIAVRLDESAELTKQASEAVQTLHRELGGISQSLVNSILTIQNFQKETLVELQGFADNLGQTLTQFQTDTKGVLQQTADEINRAVDQSIVGMTSQRSAFEASAEQAAATFRGIREELQTALHERAEVEQQMLQGTRTGIIQILTQANTAFQQQSNTLETVGNQASGLMNDARNNLLATLENIDSTLTATRQTVQDDLTKFREEYQANLQAFFQQQNDLLEDTLGQQRDGLNQVVQNLDQVFQQEAQRRSQLTQEIDQTMNNIQHSVQRIHELAIAAGLHDSQRLIQLNALAENIGQQVQKVDNSYKNLDEKFAHSLNTWQNLLQGSMKNTVDLQENFFRSSDHAMTRICSDLLRSAEVLVAANDNSNFVNGRNGDG